MFAYTAILAGSLKILFKKFLKYNSIHTDHDVFESRKSVNSFPFISFAF